MATYTENNIGKPPLTPSPVKKIKHEPHTSNTKVTYQSTPSYSHNPYDRYQSTDVKAHNPSLNDLFRPHVESFNYAVTEGISQIPAGIYEQSIDIPRNDNTQPTQFRYWIEDVQIGQPTKTNDDSIDNRLFPNEVCNCVPTADIS